MAAPDKDTIYVDIDDEITGIIDKLQASNGKVVALVLPKRAAAFQSIVNMKLLKRAADSGNKNLALITTEAGLLPLAGVAGIHVAKSLTSKPEIPLAPKGIDDIEETIGEDGAVDPDQTVGQLAGTKPAADGVETLVLDDEDLPPEAGADKPASPKTFEPPKGKGKGKKNKKLAIPDFNKFRLILIGGALLLILLIIGVLVTGIASPKATITIKTDSTNVDVATDLSLSTTATKLDEDNKTLPAKLTAVAKTGTQQVPTTGQKNNGNKASGSVGLQNCTKTDGGIVIPAGTGLSSGGNTYITQQSVTLPESSFSGSNNCKTSRESVSVIAQNPGTAFNGATSFSVAGYGDVNGTASGSISGGTDNIVHSVNQNDINSARDKIAASNEAEIKKTLKSQLSKDKLYAIDATYSAGTPAVAPSANVGAVADSVTVTVTTNYTMFGVKKDELRKIIKSEIEDQIDTGKQTVLDDGIDKATYNVNNLSPTVAQLSFSSTAVAGPDLNVDTLKEESAGKKPGVIKDELNSNPDVTGVDVKLSPFWVGTVPKNTEKIKVEIAKPSSNVKAGNSNDDN